MSESQKTEDKLQILQDVCGLGVFCWDLNSHSLQVNDLFFSSFDPPQEFDSSFKTFFSWIYQEDRKSFKDAVNLHLNEDIPFDIEVRMVDESGNVKKYGIRASSIRVDGAPKYLFGVIAGSGLGGGGGESEDLQEIVSEHQNLVLQSARMSALGEMAGGIAHEINNPVAIIMGKVEVLRRLIDSGKSDPEKVREALGKIEFTASRISKIVKGLKAFSRDSAEDPFEPVTIKTIVEDTLVFCEAKLKQSNVELKIEDFSDELKVECRPSQLSQVLLNLISNARDAIHDREEKWIRIEVQDLGKWVSFSVTDCGDGIPEEVREKILQPFFTTKEVGKGTGLGLSISKGIIDSHRGKMEIDASCVNTRFVVTLPKNQQKKSSRSSEQAA